jgi:hypothetical protein
MQPFQVAFKVFPILVNLVSGVLRRDEVFVGYKQQPCMNMIELWEMHKRHQSHQL